MAQLYNSAEKRANPRVSLEIPLKCRLMEGSLHADSISEMRKKTINSKSVDVSLSGMYIRTEQPLSVGTVMALDFSLPEKPTELSAFAEVVRDNEEGVGIQFLALKAEDLESLKSTLTKAASRR